MDYINEYVNYKQKYIALKNNIKQRQNGGMSPIVQTNTVQTYSDKNPVTNEEIDKVNKVGLEIYNNYYKGFNNPTSNGQHGLPSDSTDFATNITLSAFENRQIIYYKSEISEIKDNDFGVYAWLKFITKNGFDRLNTHYQMKYEKDLTYKLNDVYVLKEHANSVRNKILEYRVISQQIYGLLNKNLQDLYDKKEASVEKKSVTVYVKKLTAK